MSAECSQTKKCAFHDISEHDDGRGCFISSECLICVWYPVIDDGGRSGFSGDSLSPSARPARLSSVTSVSVVRYDPLYSHLNQFLSEYFGLKGVLEQPSIGSTKIPSIVFCIYQLMFAAITFVIALFILRFYIEIIIYVPDL